MAVKVDKLTGVQKAAVLFIALGPDVSSNIIKRLPEKDIQRITYEITNTAKLRPNLKDMVL
ncbi:MAG TPA: flagellar motor switch protein FliG, partial [Clostridiaceae bacterium]|nr:flagellar motor switch protein FliG [Clostridiaceae bacterium]